MTTSSVRAVKAVPSSTVLFEAAHWASLEQRRVVFERMEVSSWVIVRLLKKGFRAWRRRRWWSCCVALARLPGLPLARFARSHLLRMEPGLPMRVSKYWESWTWLDDESVGVLEDGRGIGTSHLGSTE